MGGPGQCQQTWIRDIAGNVRSTSGCRPGLRGGVLSTVIEAAAWPTQVGRPGVPVPEELMERT